jgi:hypothetical protein
MSNSRRVAAILTAAVCTGGMIVVPHADAAGTVKSAVSLTGPASGKYGTYVKLIGTAWRYGTTTRLTSATIWLQRTPHGASSWSNVTSTKTSSTGTFAFSVLQRTPYDYRAFYAGSPVYTANVSAKVYPAVRQNVPFDSMRTVTSTSYTGNTGVLEATGRVYPTPPKGTTVFLQRYNAATKSWTNYISGRTTGTNAVTIRGSVVGNVGTYRLYAPQRGYYAAGYSTTKVFAHYVWRGLFTKPLLASGGTSDPHFHVYSRSEDAFQSMVGMWAGYRGSVWIEASTYRCTRLSIHPYNVTNHEAVPTTIRAGLLNGTTYLRSADLTAGTHANWDKMQLNGLSRVRLQMEHLGWTGVPRSVWWTAALCAS